MTFYRAEKVVIVTERLILKGVCDIIESCGATGYTILSAGGKGARNRRATAERASVVDDFSNVQIDVIVTDRAMAQCIMDKVAAHYLKDYSGITYLEQVDVLRPGKFSAKQGE